MQGVPGLHKAGYGTPVTLIGDKAAAEAVDALQAAYFRRSLCAERAQLLAEICTRGDNIAKRTDRAAQARRIDSAHTCEARKLRCGISTDSSPGSTIASRFNWMGTKPLSVVR